MRSNGSGLGTGSTADHLQIDFARCLTVQAHRYRFARGGAGVAPRGPQGEEHMFGRIAPGPRPAALLIAFLIALGVVAAGPAGGASDEADLVRVVVQLERRAAREVPRHAPGTEGRPATRARPRATSTSRRRRAARTSRTSTTSTRTSSRASRRRARARTCSGATTPPSTA